MFRQLVTPLPGSPHSLTDYINSLFTYHPLQIAAILEATVRNRYNKAPTQITSPFFPWPRETTYPLLKEPFVSGYDWSNPAVPQELPLLPEQVVLPIQQPRLGWGGMDPGSNTRRPRHFGQTGTTCSTHMSSKTLGFMKSSQGA